MKNQCNFYTDPIVYQEGFFEDKNDEIKFLKRAKKALEKWVKEQANAKK